MALFATQKSVSALSERLTTLESNFSELKTANKHLELEWEELYDKVRRQMARMSKRYAVDQKENGVDPEADPAQNDDPMIDPISAGIHARRKRGFLTR